MPGTEGIHWLILELSCPVITVNKRLLQQKPDDVRVTKVLAFGNEGPGDSGKQPRSAKVMAKRREIYSMVGVNEDYQLGPQTSHNCVDCSLFH